MQVNELLSCSAQPTPSDRRFPPSCFRDTDIRPHTASPTYLSTRVGTTRPVVVYVIAAAAAVSRWRAARGIRKAAAAGRCHKVNRIRNWDT